MTRRRRSWAGSLLALGILTAACGNDDDPTFAQTPGGTAGGSEESAGETAGTPASVALTADDIAFDRDRIEVAAGEEITVTFENLDDGVQHNFHVEAGEVDVATDIAPGPDTQDLTFAVDESGTFICDVHPDQMTGEVVVS